MATRQPGTIEQVRDFDRAGKLSIPVALVEGALDSGETLEYEASEFKDSGPDFTALYLGDRRVGYWEGY